MPRAIRTITMICLVFSLILPSLLTPMAAQDVETVSSIGTPIVGVEPENDSTATVSTDVIEVPGETAEPTGNEVTPDDPASDELPLAEPEESETSDDDFVDDVKEPEEESSETQESTPADDPAPREESEGQPESQEQMIQPAATGNENVTMTPSSGVRITTAIRFQGSGFANSSWVNAYWDPAGVNENFPVQANSSGVIDLRLPVPNYADDGTYTILVQLPDQSWSKSFQFTVTGSPDPLISVWPETALAGETIQITGSWYRPNEGITVRHGSTNGPVIDTFTADDQGAFANHPITIPGSASVGTNTFWAIGSRGQQQSFTVDVISADTPTLTLNPPWPEHPNWVIGFDGQFYEPDEVVSIRLGSANGTEITSVTANGRGEIWGTFQIPGAQSSTTYTIVAVGSAGQAQATFTTSAADPFSLNFSSTVVGRGETVTISGTGFPANQEVEIFIGQMMMWPDYNAMANGSGSFSMNYHVPANMPIGTVHIYAKDYRGIWVQSSFEVAPKLVVDPSSVLRGSDIQYHATGFDPAEVVALELAGQQLLTVQANGQGVISGQANIPISVEPGEHSLVANGERGLSATTTLTVLEATVIVLSPDSGLAGSDFTIHGVGFMPNELVTFRIGGYSGTILGQAESDASGKVYFDTTIPTDTPTGPRWVTALGTSGKGKHIAFDITGPAVITMVNSPDSGLAGSDFTIHVTGFMPNELVTFRIGGYSGTILGQAQAGSNGKVSFDTMIPVDTPTGPRWVTALGTSGKGKHIAFDITGPAVITMVNSPDSGLAGSDFTIHVGGFAPNELITFRIGGYSGTILGQARAGANGKVSFETTIPVTTPTGPRWVTSLGTSGKGKHIAFDITGPAVITMVNSPDSGLAGSDFTIHVGGFAPNELITFRIGGYSGTILGQARAGANGKVSFDTMIPVTTPTGPRWVTALGTSGKGKHIAFDITGPAVITMVNSPSSGPAGSNFTIHVGGFMPNELITFRIGGYSGTILGQARAGANGKVSFSTMIPVDTPIGPRWVTALGTSGKGKHIAFNITGPSANHVTMPVMQTSRFSGTVRQRMSDKYV